MPRLQGAVRLRKVTVLVPESTVEGLRQLSYGRKLVTG
jgi:hypothetical protein